MSDTEARDAYLGVEVDLPNGQRVTGKPIPYGEAMRLMALSDQWAAGGNPKETLLPVLESFHRLTGITMEEIGRKDPNMSLGDVLGLINRFFFLRSPERVAPNAQNVINRTPPNGA